MKVCKQRSFFDDSHRFRLAQLTAAIAVSARWLPRIVTSAARLASSFPVLRDCCSQFHKAQLANATHLILRERVRSLFFEGASVQHQRQRSEESQSRSNRPSFNTRRHIRCTDGAKSPILRVNNGQPEATVNERGGRGASKNTMSLKSTVPHMCSPKASA